MDLVRLQFSAVSTSADLMLVVRFDKTTIFDSQLGPGQHIISHEFDDEIECQHVLEIEMQGKTQQHTRIDEHGNILQDHVIEIADFSLDGLEWKQKFYDNCEYHHDGNGTREPMTQEFWGAMGCNGVVRLEFSSPSYMWLLEKM
jgi:hypothetical protein